MRSMKVVIALAACVMCTSMSLLAFATESQARWLAESANGSNLLLSNTLPSAKSDGIQRVRSVQVPGDSSDSSVSLLFEQGQALISLCRAEDGRISCRQYDTDADDLIVTLQDATPRLWLVGPHDLIRECRLQGRSLVLSCSAPSIGGLAAVGGARFNRNGHSQLSTVVENDVISCNGVAAGIQCSAPRALWDPNRAVTMGRLSGGAALGALAFFDGRPLLCVVERGGVSNCGPVRGAEAIASSARIAWTPNLRGLEEPAIVALSESSIGTCVPRAHSSLELYDIDCRWTEVGKMAGLRAFLSAGTNPRFGESLVVAAPLIPGPVSEKLTRTTTLLDEALSSQVRELRNGGISTKTFEQDDELLPPPDTPGLYEIQWPGFYYGFWSDINGSYLWNWPTFASQQERCQGCFANFSEQVGQCTYLGYGVDAAAVVLSAGVGVTIIISGVASPTSFLVFSTITAAGYDLSLLDDAHFSGTEVWS